MKEFKKWWKKDSMEGDWDYERYAERGWEAALEWVLSIDSGFCSCGVPNDSWQEEGALAKIEKELKDQYYE